MLQAIIQSQVSLTAETTRKTLISVNSFQMTTKYTPEKEALFAMGTREFIRVHYLDCQNDERKRKNKNSNNNLKKYKHIRIKYTRSHFLFFAWIGQGI